MAIFPHKKQFGHEDWMFEPMLKLISYCNNKGIVLIDMYKDLADYEKFEIYYKDDMHFNFKGQDIWTGALANKLKQIIKKLSIGS